MLQGKEGRKPLKDKDVKSLAPVEPLAQGSTAGKAAGQHRLPCHNIMHSINLKYTSSILQVAATMHQLL